MSLCSFPENQFYFFNKNGRIFELEEFVQQKRFHGKSNFITRKEQGRMFLTFQILFKQEIFALISFSGKKLRNFSKEKSFYNVDSKLTFSHMEFFPLIYFMKRRGMSPE